MRTLNCQKGSPHSHISLTKKWSFKEPSIEKFLTKLKVVLLWHLLKEALFSPLSLRACFYGLFMSSYLCASVFTVAAAAFVVVVAL